MAEQQVKDSWDLDSGLPDDFDFHITGASFGYRQEYMDGEVPLLIWEGESPDEDVESIIWPCGQGWEVIKGGAEVQHPKRNRFVKTSMMGKLISRVVNELGVDMRSRGPATRAEVRSLERAWVPHEAGRNRVRVGNSGRPRRQDDPSHAGGDARESDESEGNSRRKYAAKD